MAGDSGSPLTVTISSSGRVVKRKSRHSDGRCSGSGDSGVVSERKGSVKSRLETGNDSFDVRKHLKSKRHKKGSSNASRSTSDSNDSCLDKGDLRYKILQKNMSRETHEMDLDLRDRLSRRTNLPPADSRSRPKETTHETRKKKLDSRDSRQSVVEHRKYDSDKQITPEPYIPEQQTRQDFRDVYVDGRKIVQQPENFYHRGRQIMQNPNDSCDLTQQYMPEPRESYDCRRQDRMGLAPSRSASNFTAVDMTRSPPAPPSPWPYDNSRQRSPDRSFCSSVPTAYYPERDIAERHNVTLISPYGDGNSVMYRNNDISSPPRTSGLGAFMDYPASHGVSSMPATRPMTLVEQYPQTIGYPPKAPYTVEQPSSVLASFLQHLGLEKFVVNFMAEEVDFNALRQMTGADLKELNIPMGPRKKILQALSPQSRRPL